MKGIIKRGMKMLCIFFLSIIMAFSIYVPEVKAETFIFFPFEWDINVDYAPDFTPENTKYWNMTIIFDAEDYVKYNPDLLIAYGYDEDALMQHFLEHGMSEGRIASEWFNVHAYMQKNPDLVEIYGTDYFSYFMHYVNWGYYEYRSATYEDIALEVKQVNSYTIYRHTQTTANGNYIYTYAGEDRLQYVLDAIDAAGILPTDDDLTKIRKICIYLHNTVAYDYEALYQIENNLPFTELTMYNQEAYGALCLKRAVCGGFSSAAYVMCDALGIGCDPVGGRTGDGGKHAWNMVVINGVEYGFDATWGIEPMPKEKFYQVSGHRNPYVE